MMYTGGEIVHLLKHPLNDSSRELYRMLEGKFLHLLQHPLNDS